MLPAEPNERLERVRFELRATGVKPSQFHSLRTGTHTRGYLPHVKREGARYFVTFRLEDSLPKEVLLKIQSERAANLNRFYANQAANKQGSGPAGSQSLEEIEREYHKKLEQFLDRGW